MKKIVLLLIAIVLFSCDNKPKDYVTLYGKTTNFNSKAITITGKNYKKIIAVDENGNFKDTLNITAGFHRFSDNKIQSFVYLKNGYDLTLSFDANDFPNSIKFDGNGSGTNNYLTSKLKLIKEEGIDNYKTFFELSKPEFDARLVDISTKVDALLNNAVDLDPEVFKMEEEGNAKLIEFYTTNYQKEHGGYASLKKGMPSPKFNYPNTKGINVSLDDLKGKYVYVDVWATWCAPCKQEIPFLKKLDEKFKNKNIVFVSLSIDKVENKEKWLKMVADENLQGIQIMTDKDWNSDFVKAYNIQGIPRFILIDKEGNILDANAPRPSESRLEAYLNNLDL